MLSLNILALMGHNRIHYGPELPAVSISDQTIALKVVSGRSHSVGHIDICYIWLPVIPGIPK